MFVLELTQSIWRRNGDCQLSSCPSYSSAYSEHVIFAVRLWHRKVTNHSTHLAPVHAIEGNDAQDAIGEVLFDGYLCSCGWARGIWLGWL